MTSAQMLNISVHAWMTQDGQRSALEALQRLIKQPVDVIADLIADHVTGEFTLPGIARLQITIGDLTKEVEAALLAWEAYARRQIVADAMEALDATQSELAEAVGVSQPAVSQWLSYTKSPSMTALILCDAIRQEASR